ncbi:hypothetical protein HHK36_026922 [Tetracentron sinense]|uniref:Pentatricopeptide repeat-containing protein n=1 Tax=Tetracentron sinense TaxID=13715 RepID=A0A834YJK4_TETSI|nr:hypothetical protein HHK36_026922 [Tetracentron sinense]
MLEFGSNPNNFTFSSILSACASINAIREGEQVHSLLVKYGLHWDIYIDTALIILYAKSMRLVDSHQIFEKMPSKNLAAQNSMIYAYTNCGRMEDADALFREVPEKDFVTYTSMIMGYGGCGDIESACILFDEMPERNVGAWNTMILVYSRNGYGNEALSIFSEMLTSGIDANELTLASMLSVCGKYGFSSMGRGLHSYIMKLGMKIDEYLGSGLIDMYAKCGFIEMAEQVFLQMSDKKLASWNAMIFGFGAHGHGEAALAKFSEMEIEGIIPNDLTLLGVLSSCSHSGLVHEGCLNFSTMVQKHKLVPKLEHYSCLVDLLGRAGHLNEALDTIKNMSMEPDVFVWGSLLSACRMHSNVELGEYALERILELDAKHSGGYVLLSNIYSSMGQWDCASQIKVAMREKGVEKSFPGCSWIEVKKVVHRFHASDRSHPQTHEVYEILNFLSRELKNNWSIC